MSSEVAERTPYLLIVGDLLAQEECGLICHRRDLDHFKVEIAAPHMSRHWSRHSASGEMAIPVLIRLVEVALSRYPEGVRLNDEAGRQRKHLRRALKELKAADANAPLDPAPAAT